MMHQRPAYSIAVRLRYTGPVTDTAVARGESRKVPRRTTADWRYFFVRMPSRAFTGRALAGVRSRTPVPLDAGLSTLPCARPPRLRAGRRVSTQSKEAAMPNTLARPEHTQSQILAIVREALRAAVLAQSDRDSADLAAAALVRVAELARVEVRHG